MKLYLMSSKADWQTKSYLDKKCKRNAKTAVWTIWELFANSKQYYAVAFYILEVPT